MTDRPEFDFWYAVNNTEVVVRPNRQLETFGTTIVDYHLVSQLMDSTTQVRVREGRLQAYRPEIITPSAFASSELEGFTEGQAAEYLDWLREHERELMILKYGFKIRKEAVNEVIVTDSVEAVVERARQDVERRNKPFSAVLVGVDEPWEVCLLKLLVELVQQSGPHHVRALQADPAGHRHEIEQAFRAAARNRSLIPVLAGRLKQARLFAEYEDRFYALVRSVH